MKSDFEALLKQIQVHQMIAGVVVDFVFLNMNADAELFFLQQIANLVDARVKEYRERSKVVSVFKSVSGATDDLVSSNRRFLEELQVLSFGIYCQCELPCSQIKKKNTD